MMNQKHEVNSVGNASTIKKSRSGDDLRWIGVEFAHAFAVENILTEENPHALVDGPKGWLGSEFLI